MNEQITAPVVRLVSEDDSQEMKIEEALALAREEELDLIEVSPKAQPPVVKIADFGQHLYQVKKKTQKQRAGSKQTGVKTLRFGFRTERHDLERLMQQAKGFLEERHLVKFVVRLRGRELGNKDYAKDKLSGIVKEMSDVAEVETELKKQGNQFIVILRAKK